MSKITMSNNKLSISSGHLVATNWEFIPFDELMAIQNAGLKADKRYLSGYRIVDMSALFTFTGYFLKLYAATHLEGTFEPAYIFKNSPTIWNITYTPPDGESRHIAIEHDELTPEKLVEVCK